MTVLNGADLKCASNNTRLEFNQANQLSSYLDIRHPSLSQPSNRINHIEFGLGERRQYSSR